MANNVMGMFNTDKGKGQHLVGSNMKLAMDNINDSMSNIPQSELPPGESLQNSAASNLPPTKDGQRKTSALGSSST
jgi:hypothetical protein